MPRTLSEILIDANAVLDLEATAPTGDELTTRANYANQAILDAAATSQFSEFKREYVFYATGATVSLPSDFREPQEDPHFINSSGQWDRYQLIEPVDKYEFNSEERYAYVMGDPAGGYNLIINSLASAATGSIMYQRYPSGLLTLSDVCEVSDPQYVVRQVEQYVLYSRSDERFQIAEQRAGRALSNMVGREMKGSTSGSRGTKSTFRNPLRGRR